MPGMERTTSDTGKDRAVAALQAIKAYRRLSDGEIAAAVGLGRSSVQAYMSGQRHLTIGLLYEFADVLDVDPQVFLMEPDEAIRWVLEHTPNGTHRSRRNRAKGRNRSTCFSQAVA